MPTITMVELVADRTALNISSGEESHLQRRIGQVLEVIPSGATVSLEGPPIYLNQRWGIDQELGYNYLLPMAWDLLLRRGCILEHVVMLDDYTVPEEVEDVEYLSKISLPVSRIEREAAFIPRAEDLLRQINGKGVQRLDGRRVVLTTQSGRLTCALLDAAFQETKGAVFNVVIHPTEFKHEQEDMRAVLLAARGKLPSTFVNIFFKGRSISKVYITTPEGRSERVGLL